MKRIRIFTAALLIIFSCTLNSFASGPPTIKADDVNIALNEEIEVKVSIENNPGLTGFKISINYSPDELDVVSVKKGSVL